MIGVKPLFSGSALNDQDTASFDVAMVAPDGKADRRKTGSNGSCSASSSKYQWYRSNGYWSYEPIKVTRRVADGTIDVAPDKPGKISVPGQLGPLPARSDERRPARARDHIRLRLRLVRRGVCRHAGSARDRSRQEGI